MISRYQVFDISFSLLVLRSHSTREFYCEDFWQYTWWKTTDKDQVRYAIPHSPPCCSTFKMQITGQIRPASFPVIGRLSCRVTSYPRIPSLSLCYKDLTVTGKQNNNSPKIAGKITLNKKKLSAFLHYFFPESFLCVTWLILLQNYHVRSISSDY